MSKSDGKVPGWTKKRQEGRLLSELSSKEMTRVNLDVHADVAKELRMTALKHDVKVTELMRWLIDGVNNGRIEIDKDAIKRFRR